MTSTPADSRLAAGSQSSASSDAPARRPFHKRLAFRLPLAFVLVVAVGFLAWWYLAHFVFFNLHEIIPGQAYRSAQPSPAFLEKLAREKGVKSVIKFNGLKDSDWSAAEPEAAQRLGLDFIHIHTGVGQLPPKQDMVRMIEAIESAPRPLLIHCKTGADRSGVAAVLLAMQAGQSYAEAKSSQLGLQFLHTGHWGTDIADVFKQYEEDRRAAGKQSAIGTYEDFRNYIVGEYYPGFYHAGIEPQQTELRGAPGETVTFTVKVTNLSREAWPGTDYKPFHLELGIPGTGKDHYPDVLAEVFVAKRLEPGESRTVELPVKVPDLPPGKRRYILDIHQKHWLSFSDFGSPRPEVYIDVLPKGAN